MQINELVPGTAYLFRVQALSNDGGPGGSSIEEQFETSSEGLTSEPQRQNSQPSLQFHTLTSVISFLFRTSQHRSRLWGGSGRSGHVVRGGDDTFPTQTVSNDPPRCRLCLTVLSISGNPPSFLSGSSSFPLLGLRMSFSFIPPSPRSHCQQSLSFYLGLCPRTIP